VSRLKWHLALSLAGLVALCPLLAAPPRPTAQRGELEHFDGKVQPLADVVSRASGKLDADAAASLVLVADDGKVYSLIKDNGSRLFFKDPALLRRPVRLTGRLLPGSQILEVRSAHSYVKGQLCEIYYWCDVCSIKRREKNICECCGGPMELHEDPVKK
jgi:hypothetical protein